MDQVSPVLHRLRSLTGNSTGQQTLFAEYKTIRSQTAVMKKELNLTTEVGAQKDNIKKNRYKDILPYDQTRVFLSLLTDDSDSDYINASFIQGATPSKLYIATQGPLNTTVGDFWRMIWQYNVKVLVMACREVEIGKKKCECYWAPVNQTSSFGPFTVYNQGEVCPNEEMVVRNLTVTYQQVCRSVVQYQYQAWPDHDVPYQAAGVLEMLDQVRHSQGDHTGPVLVHCSAGCGRSGVICALDYIHDLLVTKQITADFSIMKIILDLRRQRPAAVQTKEQYQFVFLAVVSMFEKVLQPPVNHHYYNLQQVKQPVNDTTDTLKKPGRKKTTGTAETKSSFQPTKMNDTYAVVNKPKQPHPPSTSHTHSPLAPPRSADGSRATPSSHHYDNDASGAMATPVYSTVRPRARPINSLHPATPIYDTAGQTIPRPGEGSPSLGKGINEGFETDERQPSSEDEDYEYVSNPAKDTSDCSPAAMGFNCRIKKPRGPRDPPAEWSRLER